MILLAEPVKPKKRKSYFFDDDNINDLQEIKEASGHKNLNETVKKLIILGKEQLKKELKRKSS